MIERSLRYVPEELILEVDASIVESEKREAAWTYQKVRGYQPLLGYVNELCVHHEFRAGNESAGARAVEFIDGCGLSIPDEKRIYLRSDSAFYQADVFNHCEEKGHRFSITADQDCAVKAAISRIKESEWKEFRNRDGFSTGREIAETVHTMNKTSKSFRLIVLRWKNAQPDLFEPEKYYYHAVATNPDQKTGAEVRRRHQRRGASENWHKELKLGYGMSRRPCGQFGANALYFAIGVLAYNLGMVLKREVLPEEYRHSTVATLRWKIYRLAGKLVDHSRQLILRLKTSAETLAMITTARAKCFAML